MPIMPRTSKKSTKIAYSILGKPANMQRAAFKKYRWPRGQNSGYDEYERITPELDVYKR